MNRKEFEEALMSTIVEYISDQVILRYAQACKKATVLFSGALIVDDSQFVIIPSLTINTAAKVANCISDNLLTNMISRAMATGKPIVAAMMAVVRITR